MRITKREQSQKLQMAKPLKDLIDDLTSCSIKSLPKKLNKINTWNKPRGDLFQWIPVLNRLDTIYEEKVQLYNLDDEFTRLQEISHDDLNLLVACLEFTRLLLENCANRSIFASAHRIYELLNSCSIPLRLASLKVLTLLAERFANTGSNKFAAPASARRKILRLATYYPLSVLSSFGSEHFTLLDTLNQEKKFPSKWRSLDFEYYLSTLTPSNEIRESATATPSKSKMKPSSPTSTSDLQSVSNKKKSKNKNKSKIQLVPSEGVHHFSMSEETVRKLSFQQIYDKACESIPKESWFEFGLVAPVAKAFNNKSFESLKLREQLIQIKCLSIAFTSCIGSTTTVSFRIMESEPYMFNFLIDLIDLENNVPKDVYNSAVKTLELISRRRFWSTDIVRTMSGNVTHGMLFQTLRIISKKLKEDDSIPVESYLNFFAILKNLIDSKSLVTVLISAGLLNNLMDFLKIGSRERMILSSVVTLISTVLSNAPDYVDSFISNNGLNLLIETIGKEVDFCLENPGYDGGAPKDALIHYTISFKQADYLKSLLKFAFNLVQIDSSDRMRNLFDSPLLGSLSKIIRNPTVFGPPLITHTLYIVSGIIHNEPTAFPILHESQIIDDILRNLDSLFGPSNDLLLAIPEVLGAICLNNEGLKKVQDLNSLETTFKIFENVEYVKALVQTKMPTNFGSAIDELGRHFPVLKPIILKCILDLITQTPAIANKHFKGISFYASPKGSLYSSTSDEIVDDEEGSKPIQCWELEEGAFFIDNLGYLVSGLIQESNGWKLITDSITLDDWLPLFQLTNTPFDFTYSAGFYQYTEVLKCFENPKNEYGLMTILEELTKQLKDLEAFIIHSSKETSFFAMFDGKEESATKILKSLNCISSVLLLFTSVYLSVTAVFPLRYASIAAVFGSNEGIEAIRLLGLLYERCAFEEAILRCSMPPKVAKETCPYRDNHEYTPIQIFTDEPVEEIEIDTKTSAKFKNSLQIRCLAHKIQSSIGVCFSFFGRLCMNKKQDFPNNEYRKTSVRITQEVAKSMVHMLSIDTKYTLIESGYFLVVIHLLVTMISGRIRSEQIQVSLGICLLQYGGFTQLQTIASSYWRFLQTLDLEKVIKTSEINYLSNSIESVTKNIVGQATLIFTKIVNEDKVGAIPHYFSLFPNDVYGYITNATRNDLTASFLVQTRILAADMVRNLLDVDIGTLNNEQDAKKLPTPLIDQLIDITKHIFLEKGEHDSRGTGILYPLEYERVRPADSKLDYLESIGFSRVDAANILKFDDVTILKNTSYPSNPHFILNHEEWPKFVERARLNPYREPEYAPIPPQVEQAGTLEDLNVLRKAQESTFIDQWLLVAQLFPKAVHNIADLLISVYTYATQPEDCIVPVMEYLYSFDFESEDQSSKIAAMIRLYSLLLQNDSIFIKSGSSIEAFLSLFMDSMKPEYANRDWFCCSLLVLERVLTSIDVPKKEEFKMKCEVKVPEFEIPYHVPKEIYNKFLESILNISSIKNVKTGLAISRILVIYAKNPSTATKIAKSPILTNLIMSVSDFIETDKNLAFQSTILILVRCCFENADVIKANMALEMEDFFKNSRKGSKDLVSMTKESSLIIMRAPEIFCETISKEIKLDNCEEPLTSLIVSRIAEDELPKEDIVMTDASTGEKIDTPSPKSSDLDGQTGIMHKLLSELMKISKKDWISDPVEDAAKSEKQKDGKDKDKDKKKFTAILKNPLCAYACFILQMMIELLCSYKQSKLEFLTFSKKQLFQGSQKPRSTALNFLIHQLIPTDSLNVSQGNPYERKFMVSTLARLVILAFVSTPITQNQKKADFKKEDLDQLFIRKFTVDTLLKILKETSISTETANNRYSKITDLSDLISAMLSSKYRDMLGNCLNSNVTKYDSYFLGKVMIEKGVPSYITSVLSDLDLNFPQAKRVAKSCIKPLNLLGAIKSQNQDLFKECQNGEGDEEEVVSDEYDFREETPDLFRNSTLGMYDVDDIDSEEEELDYYDENGPLDVVYSEEEGSQDDDSDGINSDEDSDLSLDGDELDDMVHDHADGDDDMSDDYSGDDEAHIHAHMIQPFNGDDNGVVIDDMSDLSDDDDEAGDDDLVGDNDHIIEGDSDDYESFSFDEAEEEENLSVSEDGDFDHWVEAFEHEENEEAHNGHEEVDTDDSDRLSLDFEDEFQVMADEDNDSVIDENDGVDFLLHDNSRRLESRLEIRNQRNPVFDTSSGRLLDVFARGVSGNGFGNLVDHLLSAANAENSIGGSFRGRDVNVPMRHLHRFFNLPSKKDSNLFPNLLIKSTKERWTEVTKMFHDKDIFRVVLAVLPSITNNIYDSSLESWKKKKELEKQLRAEKEKEKEEKLKQQQEEERRFREQAENEEVDSEVNEEESSNVSHVPIYVRIGDEEVDIGGTDIDPEFFEALPDEMREEVFTQHIRERRAVGQSAGYDTREIDPDFLEALPETIREEILQQEALSNHANATDNESTERESNTRAQNNRESSSPSKNENKKSTKQKIYFTPLVDRFGVSALVRLLFVPQSLNQRETLHQLLEYLCFNKQTRAEVMGLLISILQDGILSQRSLEKSFCQISSRAKVLQNAITKGSTPKTPMVLLDSKPISSQFPSGSSPLVVANQSVVALQYLLESDPHMRYYFLTEHENPFILKKLKRNQKLKIKDTLSKATKYPINYLLDLLDKKLVSEEPGLMDILSRALQVASRPLNSFKKNKDLQREEENKEASGDSTSQQQSMVTNNEESEDPKLSISEKPAKEKVAKQFEPPYIPDQNLRKIVTILVANECSSKTFQQVLSAMQNLSVISSAQKVFPVELSDHATKLGHSLIFDLNSLVTEIKSSSSVELKGKALGKFTPPSSDQTKLLRVLTALDYLFDSKQDNSETVDEIEALTNLYKKLALGSLWDALSDVLRALEERPGLSHVATALLPLIEALMVVCKHSKVKELQIKDALRYESRKIDFAKEPIESLFFSFTDEHKKILNQMVRSNPRLMSGPFSMLVRNPRVLEFDNKKNFFDRKLHWNNEERTTLNVSVRRDHVFLDSYRAVFFKPSEEFRKAKLDVSFKGEAGVDAGGVTREWFQVLSRQMFNADYALFTPVASDKTTFHPNRTSYANPEHLSFFKFIGRIIGKAIYDNCFLDCHFSRAVYKRLLSRPVSLKDMENLDLDYFKSLMWMLENDITDIITETFSVESDDFGEHKIIDLIPEGRDMAVTESNKQEYVRLVVEYRLQTSVQEQMDNFLIGFHEIIPKDLIAIFDEQELELLISGLPDIDVDDWKNNTNYNNYSPSSSQIQWFWRAVRSFDIEERAKLLQFATGTSKVPLNGFKELGGVNGFSKFSIHRDFGSTERLPSSHTCFNQIDLPEYDSYETLRGSLLLAITEGHEGFGLA